MNLYRFILIFVFGQTASQAQEMSYREVSLPPGLHTSTLDLLHTDRSGFLWLAAGPELSRFDGMSFHIIGTDTTGRPGDRITAVFDDSQGNFWIGWQSGFISLISNDSTISYDPEEGTPSVKIVKWTEDADGQLWMATDGEGLYVLDENGRWHNFSVEDGLPSSDAYDLVSFGNSVLLATDQGMARCGFSAESGKKVTVLGKEDGLSDQIVKTLFPDTAGVWIAYYEASVDLLSIDGKIKSIEAPGEDAHQVGRSGTILWWLSENGRLYRKSADAEWEPVEMGSGRRAQVRHFAFSPEGHLWISTNRGLYLLDQWLQFFPMESPVTAVHAKGDKLWYSREGDLFVKDMKTHTEQKLWGGDNLIVSLYADDYGRVWAGSFDGGLLIYDQKLGNSKIFTEKNGLINNNVLSIDGKGNEVWLGTLGGVSYFVLDENGGIQKPRNSLGEKEKTVQYVYAVHINDKGQVFIGTDGQGVLLWDGRHFKSLAKEISEDVVLDVCSDASGKLWWITPDGNLHSWTTTEGIMHLPTAPGESFRPAGLKKDPKGGLLVFHERGMKRWDVASETWTNYGGVLGLGGFQPELHSQSFAQHNHLFVGAANGIFALRLNFLPTRPRPATHITGVELFLEPTQKQSLRYNENHITFRYIGRWYTDPDAVRYKVRLNGYDLNWTTSQNREVTYPQLPPGSYEFMVVAGLDGYFPEEAIKTYSFTIHSPWYFRWYFILAVVVLLVLLGIAVFRWRLKRLNFQQQQEQEKVRAQYEAIKSQVNPHFLFNSFNTLMALIEDDKEEATEYLSSLSDFFRNILQFREIDLIPVKEEMDIVQAYLKLQEKRFGEALQVTVDLPPLVLESLIPPLTLQLLMENAFKHNVISRTKPLQLRIFTERDFLVVRNVLQEKSQRDSSTGYGLDSIRKKYSFYTKRAVRVEQGTSYFSVYLPSIPKS